MGELGRDWLRGVGVTVPVTGGGGNNQAWVCVALGWSTLFLPKLEYLCTGIGLRVRPCGDPLLDLPASVVLV